MWHFDGKKGRIIRNLIGHQARVRSAKFSSEGKRILTEDNDGIIKVWDMFSNLDNPLLANFQGYNASFSPDWKKIVTMLGLLIVHIRRFSAYVHSIQANMWQMVLSLPMFWLATILFEYPLNISAFIKSWLGIVYMGLAVNAIAFVV